MEGAADSTILLTREIITSLFARIFNSSIILNSKFEIISVNEKAVEFLTGNQHNLIGMSINCLGAGASIEEEIRTLLKKGFFTDHLCNLISLDSKKLKVKLSGFHLGLISDFNELIVLSVQNISSEHKLATRLRLWEDTMDQLAYSAAHDLRGPLATILGLVNIAQVRKDDSEVDKIFDYIKTCGETLDRRLRECVEHVTLKLAKDK